MTALRWKDGYLIVERETAEEQTWRRASGAARVLAAVEARLVTAGAVTELRQLRGLSAQEQDVLVYRELHEPACTNSQSLPPGCSQTTQGTVAA